MSVKLTTTFFISLTFLSAALWSFTSKPNAPAIRKYESKFFAKTNTEENLLP